VADSQKVGYQDAELLFDRLLLLQFVGLVGVHALLDLVTHQHQEVVHTFVLLLEIVLESRAHVEAEHAHHFLGLDQVGGLVVFVLQLFGIAENLLLTGADERVPVGQLEVDQTVLFALDH